eukprot:TRINITY_DN5483_c0_g1_i1.p1 TRINITY_DN5483_c0_g1~~TRINITY_DN5483_c0_g1_i1.p1  ORF type:complete len:227 (-),score=10.66 TRINITY_DN5483_c0_g1_i1:82-762(-)
MAAMTKSFDNFTVVSLALKSRCHVLCQSPITETLDNYNKLISLANKNNRLFCIDSHKRYDQKFREAFTKIKQTGGFAYFNSYVAAEAVYKPRGVNLLHVHNAVSIDFHAWTADGVARPIEVMATSSLNVGADNITLMVKWQDNKTSSSVGTAFYSSAFSPDGLSPSFMYQGSGGGTVTLKDATTGERAERPGDEHFLGLVPDPAATYVPTSGVRTGRTNNLLRTTS